MSYWERIKDSYRGTHAEARPWERLTIDHAVRQAELPSNHTEIGRAHV